MWIPFPLSINPNSHADHENGPCKSMHVVCTCMNEQTARYINELEEICMLHACRHIELYHLQHSTAFPNPSKKCDTPRPSASPPPATPWPRPRWGALFMDPKQHISICILLGYQYLNGLHYEGVYVEYPYPNLCLFGPALLFSLWEPKRKPRDLNF